ncbi:hypothetical protein [Kordia jejudonensis]|uniref:hypothetical protein n=1 Tax=Kordia jejudonensis TaxID=1348245 RepID=UPI0006293657|nr:hypothetical protein [Kordia jejudonensis]
MKNFIKLFIACAFLVSCGDFEEVIYDGVNGQTLSFFDASSSALEVEINQTNTVNVKIGVSTLSTSDRTVSVSADAASTADPAMYSFSSTVTIPANEYFAELAVTGIDEGLTTTAKTLILNLEDSADITGSSASHTVSIVEICPIPATFAAGAYTLDFVSGGIGAAGFAPALGTGIPVDLVVGGSSTERTFNVKCYPSFGFANPPVDFSFNLVCGTTVSNGLLDGQASGVGCGGSIAFGPAPSNGTYTVGDDTNMTIIFAEDTEEICGSVATTTYTLTKI